MNVELALDMKGRARQIIEAYEAFLFKQIYDATPNAIAASEALVAKDATRTIAMSQVNKKRVQYLKESPKPKQGNAETDPAPAAVSTSGLAAEGLTPLEGFGPTNNDSKKGKSESLFANLSDCIPCNQLWDWGDFDFDELRKILTLDIKSRLAWLLGWEDLFNGNDVLDQLCVILSMFKNLCPRDLLFLIASLMAYITKIIASIKFNFEGILKDIFGMVLRPYIQGLENFLNAYLQLFVGQIDCILANVQASAEALADLELTNYSGPEALHFETTVIDQFDEEAYKGLEFEKMLREKFDVPGQPKRTPEELIADNEGLPPEQRIISPISYRAGVKNFASDINETRMFIKEGAADISAEVANAPRFITGILQESVATLLSWTKQAQDAIADFLGGEWLVTGQSLGLIQLQRSVTTIIQIAKIALKIIENGTLEGLCLEDNLKRVIDEVNKVSPDTVVITDPTETANKQPSPNGQSAQSGNLLPRDRNSTAERVSERQRLNSSRVINFGLKKCLNIRQSQVDQNTLDRWQRELDAHIRG